MREPRLKSSIANRGAAISSHVDDWYGNIRCFETLPQLDARNIAQVDFDKDANHLVEIVVASESLPRGKHNFRNPTAAAVALHFSTPVVVIDDNDNVPI